MTIRIIGYLLVFWLMQVTAQIFFKWGSMSPTRWLWGVPDRQPLRVLQHLAPHARVQSHEPECRPGNCTGGAFLVSQIGIMSASKSKVAPVQWTGIVAIVIGMLALTAGMPRPTQPTAQPPADAKAGTAR